MVFGHVAVDVGPLELVGNGLFGLSGLVGTVDFDLLGIGLGLLGLLLGRLAALHGFTGLRISFLGHFVVLVGDLCVFV